MQCFLFSSALPSGEAVVTRNGSELVFTMKEKIKQEEVCNITTFSYHHHHLYHREHYRCYHHHHNHLSSSFFFILFVALRHQAWPWGQWIACQLFKRGNWVSYTQSTLLPQQLLGRTAAWATEPVLFCIESQYFLFTLSTVLFF